MKDNGYDRWALQSVVEALGVFRIVFVAGVRQCGKTTLTKQLELPNVDFRSLDISAQMNVALDDPSGFVRRYGGRTMVIDEVQKAPKLLSEIKAAVDEDTAKGQYLLTGSADLKKLPAVTESLAGRMGIVRLRPLAHGEVAGNKPSFVEKAFAGDFPQTTTTGYDRRAVLELAFRGGYGETFGMDGKARRLWFKSYLDAMLLHDVRDLMDVRSYQILRRMAVDVLARSSKFFSAAELMSAYGIKHETFSRFMSILKTMYLIDEVPAWSSTDYGGVGKKTKFFAADTGMVASMLNWSEEEVFFDSDRSGKMVESWVYNQLVAQTDMNPDFVVSQYRDSRKREIDFMVENGNGDILGIEVKAGSEVGRGDFSHLAWFRDSLLEGRRFTGIVLYTGETTLPFGRDLYAVPVGAICS